MSRFRGREINDIGLWSKYIDVPVGAEKETYYWDKVQCPNPNHDTQKRHFQVNVMDGLVHCFASCGISGTYHHAIKVIEGCDDRQARKIILGFAGNRRGKATVAKRVTRPVENPTGEALAYDSFIPQAGLDYLDSRGISAASVARFEIGWCPETLRLVIPARDLRGQTRFLVKRAVRAKQQPKYLYSENAVKTSLLFGACQCDLSAIRSDGIVIVEGSLDAVRLHQHGFSTCVASLGTGISGLQAKILSGLRPRRIVLFFDKDIAGVNGIQMAARRLRGKYPIFVARYPAGKSDPAELSREEAVKAIRSAIQLRTFHRRVQQLARS